MSKSSSHILGEIKGVHHQKMAIFDDKIIIGGANLSKNYFLNRRDRYLLLKEFPELSDYYYDYLQMYYENCYQLRDTSDPRMAENPNL